MIPPDVDEPEGLLTLRVGVTLKDGDDAVDLGPRVVHEVPPRTLFDHVADVEGLDGDVFPRFELTLWDETERERWPLEIAAIPRDVANALLDGELSSYLWGKAAELRGDPAAVTFARIALPL